jgi:peptide chain release factor
MMLLQLSSAQGPDECCLAVQKALDRLIKEAASQQVDLTLLDLSQSVSPESRAQKLVCGRRAFFRAGAGAVR